MTSPAFRYELDEARAAPGRRTASWTSRPPPSCAQTLAKATDELTSDLAIDLADVDFLPSSAIGVLATAQAGARRNGAAITFVAADGSVASACSPSAGSTTPRPA